MDEGDISRYLSCVATTPPIAHLYNVTILLKVISPELCYSRVGLGAGNAVENIGYVLCSHVRGFTKHASRYRYNSFLG